MPSTLKEALESLKAFQTSGKPKKGKIANKLLGKYQGIIPKEKSSTQFIKGLRKNLYGKAK